MPSRDQRMSTQKSPSRSYEAPLVAAVNARDVHSAIGLATRIESHHAAVRRYLCAALQERHIRDVQQSISGNDPGSNAGLRVDVAVEKDPQRGSLSTNWRINRADRQEHDCQQHRSAFPKVAARVHRSGHDTHNTVPSVKLG